MMQMGSESRLIEMLKGLGAAVVCYSGGIDSALLAYIATRELGEKCLSVLVSSPLTPAEEEEEARRNADKLRLNLLDISADPLECEEVASNCTQRCYHCKKLIFGRVKELANTRGIESVLDGSNADDANDIRPGIRAAKELGVRSPFMELGIGKEQIRTIARKLGIEIWNKPSYACLASRIPYGTRIDKRTLSIIAEAERYLKSLGFEQCRVRHHAELARIELPQEDMPKIADENLREQVVNRLRELGYTYVSVDLAGYRTGSMNETLID